MNCLIRQCAFKEEVGQKHNWNFTREWKELDSDKQTWSGRQDILDDTQFV